MTMMHSEIIIPCIHSNGDTSATLKAHLKEQYRTLTQAIRAFEHGAPNARNYYPIPGSFEKARAQYTQRLDTLRTMQHDLLIELEGIRQQQS